MKTVLVHLASGIGNIILSTPLLVALNRMEFVVDLLLHADYPQTAALLDKWSVVRAIYDELHRPAASYTYDHIIPAIPPFYWSYIMRHDQRELQMLRRPLDALFYEDEQEYYLWFARQLGCPAEYRPFYSLPIGPNESFGVTYRTLVIAPGSKTGAMAAKRWPYFTQLAEHFTDVGIVGTADDLRQFDGTPVRFPAHCRIFVDRLSLRETAELMAASGAVVGNDSGLAHLAAAIGAPTIMLFGPTSDRILGHLPPNVYVLRTGMECEPCWFRARFQACGSRIDCLRQISIERVARAVAQMNVGIS